ncbi:MAG: hypothetical protein Kow00121_67490 [Elainellaceae cyanobacterium]
MLYALKNLLRFTSLAAVPVLFAPSAHALDLDIAKNNTNQPLAPFWVQVSVSENDVEMFVDQNRIYQEAVSEQETWVGFFSRLHDPHSQIVADLYVQAECSSNLYAILQEESFDRNSGQLLHSYAYLPEVAEVQVAEEGRIIRDAVDYVCGR